MNRVRLMIVAGALISGGIGISPALAQAPSGVAPASTPRYYYGWGNGGWTYYGYPRAASAPAYRGGSYPTSSRARFSAEGSSPAPSDYRESGSGRNLYLAKPWMRPLR